MELIRRFISSFVNRPLSGINELNEQSVENEKNLIIHCYYMGNTFVDQPSSDELRRAVHIITTKTKKDLEKNQIPLLSMTFENNRVIVKDGNGHNCKEYEVRRIVVSCVDARNQKHLSIFYHNCSPYMGNSSKNTQGLECHLFLCKSKDIAKNASNKIGDLLSQEYQIPTRHVVKNLSMENMRMSKANYGDFDYENISKFFKQKVFKTGGENSSRSQSVLSSNYSSLSTSVTTNGCDSGCASTIASMDIRQDDIGIATYSQNRNPHQQIQQSDRDSQLQAQTPPPPTPPPQQQQELAQHQQHNKQHLNNHEQHKQIQKHIQQRPQHSPILEQDHENMNSDCNCTHKENEVNCKFHNRYSVHYELEDENNPETDGRSATKCKEEDNDDELYNIDLGIPELQRLLDMGETNI